MVITRAFKPFLPVRLGRRQTNKRSPGTHVDIVKSAPDCLFTNALLNSVFSILADSNFHLLAIVTSHRFCTFVVFLRLLFLRTFCDEASVKVPLQGPTDDSTVYIVLMCNVRLRLSLTEHSNDLSHVPDWRLPS